MLGRAAFIFLAPLVVSPEEFGKYAYLVWLGNLGIILGSLGLPQAAQRFVPLAKTGEEGVAISRYIGRLHSGLSAASLGTLLLWISVFRAPGAHSAWSTGLILAMAILGAFSTVKVGVLRGYRRFWSTALVEGIGQTVRLAALGVLWILDFQFSFLVLLSLEVLYWLSQCTFLWFEIGNRRDASPPVTSHQREILIYSSSIALAVLLDLGVWQRNEIVFLTAYASETDVGVFSLAAQAANLISVIPSALITALFPSFVGLYASNPQRLIQIYRIANSLLLACAFPLMGFGVFIVPHLLVSIFGNDYQSLALILPFLIVAKTLVLVCSVSSTMLYAVAGPRLNLWLGVSGALFSLLCNFTLIPRFGLLGAGISVLLVQPIVAITTFAITHRWLGERVAIPGRLILSGTFAFVIALYLYRAEWTPIAMLMPLAIWGIGCRWDNTVATASGYAFNRLRSGFAEFYRTWRRP